MKLDQKDGYPLILLSHRKREFLETCIESIREHATGLSHVVVIDDSGDRDHYQWLTEQGYWWCPVSHGRNAGYLAAMRMVWSFAADHADIGMSTYALLWEEDFVLTRDVDIHDMACVMDLNPQVAHLNLPRQPVYKIERRFGYMESHQRRGYELTRQASLGVPWVERRRPFTTNPGLIRRDVLDIEWPTREEADRVSGGAEPAMGLKIEVTGRTFGWFGKWNEPYTTHTGTEMKTGTGY